MKTNTNHIKYRTITDICQISGVTAQQLIDQGNYLIATIPASIYLDSDDKQSAINDAVIFTLRKMNSGHLNKFDYKLFKGYFFISLKNEVLKNERRKNYKRNIATNNAVVVDDYVEFLYFETENDFDTKNQMQIILKTIEQLNPKDKSIIKKFLDGDSIKKLGPYHFENILNKMRSKIGVEKPIKRPLRKNKSEKKIAINERHQKIYDEWKEGATKYALAQKYNTTQPTISYAIYAHKKKLNNQ